jgi:hypothetical protein
MKVTEWSKLNINYGRKLLDSGLEGARAGEGEFLHGEPLAPFLEESARHALEPATIGLFLGVLSGCAGNGHKSTSKTLLCGLLGGVIGFGVGVAWGSRRLAASVASSAFKSVGKARDEHWLENNPIDYA